MSNNALTPSSCASFKKELDSLVGGSLFNSDPDPAADGAYFSSQDREDDDDEDEEVEDN